MPYIFYPFLLTPLIAWTIAHSIKYVLAVMKTGDIRELSQFYKSGSMPSAHSATTVSLATIIGLSEGANSAIFALATLFAVVVMYDAMVARRSIGEQGVAICELIKKTGQKEVQMPRAAKGHTPLEVLVGAALGVLVSIVVFFATN